MPTTSQQQQATTAMMVFAAESHIRMMSDYHHDDAKTSKKMYALRSAAAYLWNVCVVVADGQCETGGLYFENLRQQWGRRREFLQYFHSLSDQTTKKRMKIRMLELCAFDRKLAMCLHYHRAPYAYHKQTEEAVQFLWGLSLGSDVKRWRAVMSSTNYAAESKRVKAAAKADLLALHDDVFVPHVESLWLMAVSLGYDDGKAVNATSPMDAMLYDFVAKRLPVLFFASDLECWAAAQRGLSTPDKRVLLMELHHASQAFVILKVPVLEREERRVAVAMALHARLGLDSKLKTLPECILCGIVV